MKNLGSVLNKGPERKTNLRSLLSNIAFEIILSNELFSYNLFMRCTDSTTRMMTNQPMGDCSDGTYPVNEFL